MESVLRREVNRDQRVNQSRDKALEEQAKNFPKEPVKTGSDVGLLRHYHCWRIVC